MKGQWIQRSIVWCGGFGLAALAFSVTACDKKAESEAKPVTSAAAKATTSASAKPKEPSFEEQLAASKPLSPKPKEQEVAGQKYSAELCKIEGAEFVGPSTTSLFKAVEVVGNKLVLADTKGKLHGFDIESKNGCTLKVDSSFGSGGVLELPKEINHLSSDSSGRIMASNGIFAAYAVKDGKQEFECKTGGHIELHPSGKWGIAPWVNATVKMVSFEGNTCKVEEWVLKDLGNDKKRVGPLKNVNTAGILGDTILLGGIPVEKVANREVRQVFAYDKAGKELFRFGSTDKTSGSDVFGWIHALSPCKAGICALDSNYRQISLWKKDGTHIGAIKLSALFDLKYPWIADMSFAKDGTAYFVTGQSRDGTKVAEGNIYAVKGL